MSAFSATPREPVRCPACDAPLETTRLGCCGKCGHSFAAERPFPGLVLRRRTIENGPRWYANPFYFGFGILYLLLIVIFAYNAPVILIPSAVLLIAAVLRTLRIATRPTFHDSRANLGHLLGAFISSLGVAGLAGTASTFVFCGTSLVIPGGNSISAPTSVYVWSLLPACLVFVGLFVLMWPRVRSAEAVHRPPDPEN